jgi:hypothetical protein
MNTIEQLRQAMKRQAFALRQFRHNRQAIVEFDPALFWECVPFLLKNFVGIPTLNEHQFDVMKDTHGYYDLLKKDLFKQSDKRLKVASGPYTILLIFKTKRRSRRNICYLAMNCFIPLDLPICSRSAIGSVIRVNTIRFVAFITKPPRKPFDHPTQ